MREMRDFIDAEAEAMAAAAADHLDKQVPSCPDWTVADLLFHTGRVHRVWTHVLGLGGEPPSLEFRQNGVARPPDEDLIAWFNDGTELMLAALAGADPKAPVWAWWRGEKSPAAIERRMADDTTVHRWDAESAVGAPSPLLDELALEGVQAFFDRFLGADAECQGRPGSVRLEAKEGGGPWVSVLGDGPTVTVRATASDVVGRLWKRIGVDAVALDGDDELLADFIAWAE